MGELKPASLIVDPRASNAADGGGKIADAVPVGSSSSNCGVSKICMHDEFPVHLFSGKENVDGPRLCVNGN